jgi:hypothetical protein
MMDVQKVINAPRVGAQINDRQCKSLICKESENDTFHFPQDIYEPQKVINAPRVGAQINDRQCKSLICKESENDTFRFPWSRKSRLDFLRPYQ